MNLIDKFFLNKEEPQKSCLLALDTIIKQQDELVTVAFKYGLPFYGYKGKMFAYLWVDKKLKYPYIGLLEGLRIEHELLIQGDRKRMKIMLFNPEEDLPVADINKILTIALDFYRNGIIKTKEK